MRYVALLRGINLGRNKRVAMTDLRALLEGLGHTDVRTLNTSGNVIFTGTRGKPETIGRAIAEGVARDLGVQSTVIIRSGAEISAVAALNPFSEAEGAATQFVGFLAREPSPAAIKAAEDLDVAPDRFLIRGRELHAWCPNGYLNSLFTRVKWERDLDVAMTVRTLDVVRRIAVLAEAG